jgi:hypothetical protein
MIAIDHSINALSRYIYIDMCQIYSSLFPQTKWGFGVLGFWGS